MTAKALVALAMCIFLRVALHGCGCDDDARKKCTDGLGEDAKCGTVSACIKDNGCCDEELTGDDGQTTKGSEATKSICALRQGGGTDACA